MGTIARAAGQGGPRAERGRAVPLRLGLILGVVACALLACGSSKQVLVTGRVGGTSYSAWTQGSKICTSYDDGSGGTNESCTPASSYSAARRTVDFELGCKIVFGLSRVPFREVKVVSQTGAEMTLEARSTAKPRAWSYFVFPAVAGYSMEMYQLFGQHGQALEPPQVLHVESVASIQASEGDHFPTSGSQSSRTLDCLPGQ